jgi:hypothetical protein
MTRANKKNSQPRLQLRVHAESVQPEFYAALRRELSRTLPERFRPEPELRLDPRALVFALRVVERDDRFSDLSLRPELLLLRPPAERRLEVPDAERRRDPLLERVVRVEPVPRVEPRLERPVRPWERSFRSSCICFLSSAVSRLTSLLKLLCCPRAVWTCTSSARLLSSNFWSHSSQSTDCSESWPL